jgi:hypothetical protein
MFNPPWYRSAGSNPGARSMAAWRILAFWAWSTGVATGAPLTVDPAVDLEITRPAWVGSMAELVDGRVVVSGNHDRVEGQRRQGLLLLDASGHADPAFAPRCATTVPATEGACHGQVLALPDGGFLYGGRFDAIDGQQVRSLARYGADATLDASFDPLGGDPTYSGLTVGWLHRYGSEVYAAIGTASNGWVGNPRLVRIDLQTGSVDPALNAPAGTGRIMAFDGSGRPYVATASNVVRLDRVTGAIDPTWVSGLDNVTVQALVHEPVSDRLYAMLPGTASFLRQMVRLDPARKVGLEADWQPPQLGGQPVTRWFRALAAGDGMVFAVADGSSRRALIFRASDSTVVAQSDAPPLLLAGLTARSTAGWLITTAIDVGPRYPAGTTLFRSDDALEFRTEFASDFALTGTLVDAARASDGRIAVVGDFTRIEGHWRDGIARLSANFEVDAAWPSPSLPAIARNFAWAGVAINDAGDMIGYERGPGVYFTGSPYPGFTAYDDLGTTARRFSGDYTNLVGSNDRQFYFTAGSTCTLHSIARARVPDLLSAPLFSTCLFDTQWVPAIPSPGAQLLAIDMLGRVYISGNERLPTTALRVRRFRPEPGASPDPDWQLALTAQLQTPPTLSASAVDTGHVYLSGNYTAINGAPATGLARVRLADGAIDTTWVPRLAAPPFDGQPLLDLDASGGSVYSVRYAGPTVSGARPVAIVHWSAQGDASTHAEIGTDAVVDFPDQSLFSLRNLRVVALPDGRALVAGAYTTIGGVHRDGLAVMGPAERLFMDGFD